MIIDRLDVGGAEKVALALAKAYLDNGALVSFITIDNIKTIETDPRIYLESLSFENRFNKYHYNQKKMYRLLTHIQEEKGAFDFILVHLYKASRVMKYYANAPCFHLIHNTQSSSALKTHKGLKRFLIKRKIQSVYKNQHVICVSQGVQDDLLHVMGVKPKSSHIINNPFDIQGIHQKSLEPYTLPFQGSYIIYVGRLVKEKRVDYLLHAYKKSAVKDKLLIVGDGEEMENLRQLANKLGISDNVFFIGSRPNPYKYIKGAKFLVLCSRYEGFGNVLVEALILQTPAISTNTPSGPKEILEHYTLDAVVEDNNDNDALASKIRQWATSPTPVPNNIMAPFSHIHIAQEYLKLFQSHTTGAH